MCESDSAGGYVLFTATTRSAFSVQRFMPACRQIRERQVELELDRDKPFALHYVNSLAEDRAKALDAYQQIQRTFGELRAEAEKSTKERIVAAFTPANGIFSGHLPQLETRSHSLWRLYYTGCASLLFNRVNSPHAAIAPAYPALTLCLQPWVQKSFSPAFPASAQSSLRRRLSFPNTS